MYVKADINKRTGEIRLSTLNDGKVVATINLSKVYSKREIEDICIEFADQNEAELYCYEIA